MTKTQTAEPPTPESAPATQGTPAADGARVFTNILCAVDGTVASTAAVRMAACLAGPKGHLTLLAVSAVSGTGPNASAAISPARVKRILAHVQRVAERAGVPASTVVDPGAPPARVILERAAEYELLAIGAPATSWLGGMLVGGVAARALGEPTTPLLVVRRKFEDTLCGARIVVASDGEDGSDRVVELAGRLASSLDARATLVHALGPESKSHPHRIQAQSRALELALDGAGDTHVEPGKPVEVILEAAERTGADLLVVGSRRLSGLRAFGSVSRRVTHDAPCSVLLLPPKA